MKRFLVGPAGKMILLLAFGGLVFWANLHAVQNDLILEWVQRFGYLGILFAAALSGFNLVVPIPVIAFFPLFIEAGLQPMPTVAVIAIGMTIGDLLGFTVGVVSRDLLAVRAAKWLDRLERMRERHPHLPIVCLVFYAGAIPLPNELVVVPLAFLRYPVVPVMVAVLIGNFAFNSMMAFGVTELFQWFQA